MTELTAGELDRYRTDGFVALRGAFPRDLADTCRARLWDLIDEEPDDPSTWTRPVTRIAAHTAPELHEAARSPRLVRAIAEVAGPDAAPPLHLGGTTAVRFPVDADPGDDGWHCDGSYPGPDGGWWLNHRSRGRALLVLVLFSDVGPGDAPTRLLVGSHRLVPHLLAPHGDEGMAALAFRPTPAMLDLPVALATGQAGDAHLCHPFLVHAAQRHHGTVPRFVAQPGVPWRPGTDGATAGPAGPSGQPSSRAWPRASP